MIKVFGFEISYFIISTLFPTLSFILMTLIMNTYISWRWSITLSSIAFLSFNSFAFRIFLIELLKGNGWADLGVLEKPIVMGVPFPSLSILVFLLSLYFSVILKRTSHIMIILLSLVKKVVLLKLMVRHSMKSLGQQMIKRPVKKIKWVMLMVEV